jgi:hypothetical protein
VLKEWAAEASAAWERGEDVEVALTRRYGPALEALAPEQRRRVELLNGIHSNAEGLKLWLARSGAGSKGTRSPH